MITIEKGETSPTLATLQKILKALGISFADFFSTVASGNQTPVYQLKDMKSIEDECRQYTFMLPKQTDVRFGMVYETIAPSGEEEVEWESHNFDLDGVVISGSPATPFVSVLLIGIFWKRTNYQEQPIEFPQLKHL